MSNNKQMKLYTEEQLTRYLLDEGIIELSDLANDLIPHIELPSDSLCINCDESESTHNICMDCIIKIGKENIQLPSDEEIYINANVNSENTEQHIGFIKGIQHMRELIEGNSDGN